MSDESINFSEKLFDQASTSGEIEDVIARIMSNLNEEYTLTGFENADSDSLLSGMEIDKRDAQRLYESLRIHFQSQEEAPSFSEVKSIQGDIPEMADRPIKVERADACEIHPADSGQEDNGHQLKLESDSVNLIVTSPPYWQLRDYGVDDQLGQEDGVETYIDNLIDALDRWKNFLHPKGSVFVNLGDKYHQKSVVGIPGMFAQKAKEGGWTIRNHIIWAKKNGIPDPADDRLVPRHEHIFHLVQDDDYYYDLFGYSQVYGNGSNSGDVWHMSHDRNTGDHLAPFPQELVLRAVTLACPPKVCTECGEPYAREVERPPKNLNKDRPQAERAIKKFENSDLDEKHLKAIRAVGISDAGKAKEIQGGTENNDSEVQELAEEAKEVLGGYFREFTFPLPKTVGWSGCNCNADTVPGMVFDPFAGSGTTLNTAYSLGYQAWGTDLDRSNFEPKLDHYGD